MKPFDSQIVTSAQETQRHNSESEQNQDSPGATKRADSRWTVKQRFENTNSRPITTEEVFKS